MKQIGFFDSGIGGASLLNVVRERYAHWALTYIADSAYCPYGNKTPEQIRERAFVLTKQLIERGCNVIVIACNTATMNAIAALREAYPAIVFIGVEPAIKRAADSVPTGDILLLGTDRSIHDPHIDTLINRFAPDRTVIKRSGSALIPWIEQGDCSSDDLQQALRACLGSLRDVSAIVLGCTHFIWIKELIQSVSDAVVVEPSQAIVRRVASVVHGQVVQTGQTTWITTGDKEAFERQRTALDLLLV